MLNNLYRSVCSQAVQCGNMIVTALYLSVLVCARIVCVWLCTCVSRKCATQSPAQILTTLCTNSENSCLPAFMSPCLLRIVCVGACAFANVEEGDKGHSSEGWEEGEGQREWTSKRNVPMTVLFIWLHDSQLCVHFPAVCFILHAAGIEDLWHISLEPPDMESANPM